MKNIAVLGCTGSIGKQTLEIVRALPKEFNVIGLACGSNLDLLHQQIQEFRPRLVSTGVLNTSFGRIAQTVSMEQMVQDPEIDLVMVATTGRVGLGPTLEAVKMGKEVALANKEVIVMAGELVREMARKYGAPLLPVDSEPSAIWQCLRGEEQPVQRLIITASGGPFRRFPLDQLDRVTPEEALAHPTWVMGNKITIDSSTLMNKGFEVIESHYLFNLPYDQIDVVVHPQSVVHSMVELADGSVKAQLGPPDMRLPIQYAMHYPDRLPNDSLPRFDPLQYRSLTFEELDSSRYPCFNIALEAGRAGGTYPAVLSAADETAVRLFLNRQIAFTDIPSLVKATLDAHQPIWDNSIEAILEADTWAHEMLLKVASEA